MTPPEAQPRPLVETPRFAAWLWPLFVAAVAIMPFLRGLSGSRGVLRPRSQHRLLGTLPVASARLDLRQLAALGSVCRRRTGRLLRCPQPDVPAAVGADPTRWRRGSWLQPVGRGAFSAGGAWRVRFLARRFSKPASTIGALAFALSGPIVSTGNSPNLSWSVAALPWVMWATDAVVSAPVPRRVAMLAVAVALQALGGEPVTLFATLVLAGSYALTVGASETRLAWRQAVRGAAAVAAGAGLGLALAAIQMVPLAHASAMAGRSDAVFPEVWSLRPTALLETVWLHLFGDYFKVQSIRDVPWLPLIFTEREPLLFSLYFGVPLLSLAILGLAGDGPRRWRLFWVAAGLVSVVAAFVRHANLPGLPRPSAGSRLAQVPSEVHRRRGDGGRRRRCHRMGPAGVACPTDEPGTSLHACPCDCCGSGRQRWRRSRPGGGGVLALPRAGRAATSGLRHSHGCAQR